MAKAKKKAAKKRADHYEPKVKSNLSFDELIAMSVNTRKSNLPMQKIIINAIKNSFGGYSGGDYTTTMEHLYTILPSEKREEINKEIASMEGVELNAYTLQSQVTIPAKYFQ